MPQRYTVRIYDGVSGTLLKILAQVQSARFRQAENEVGDFELTVPWDSANLPLMLVPSNLVEFWRDGTFVFGGIIRRQSVKQDGRVPMYTVSGPDYKQWLVDCMMRPPRNTYSYGGSPPITFIVSTTGTGDMVINAGDATDVLYSILWTVHAQCATVTNHFQIYQNSFSDETGNKKSYTATAYSTVMETVQAMATQAGNLTFDIVRDEDGVLRFRTYTPSRGPDKSKGTSSPVLFDLRGGNLLNAEWTRDGNNVKNAMWGGGPGDKAARYIYPAGEALIDPQSLLDWGRIEGFIDAGSETTTATDKKVAEELAKSALPEESVTFQIAPGGRYTLGEDFDFGTKVTVIWQPVLEFSDTIRGMEVRLDAGSNVANVDINVGDTITGDSTKKASLYLGRFLRQIRRSIAVQQRH